MCAWTVLVESGYHFPQFTGFQALQSSFALLLDRHREFCSSPLALLIDCPGMRTPQVGAIPRTRGCEFRSLALEPVLYLPLHC